MDETINSIWIQLQPVVVNGAVAVFIALIGLATYKIRQYIDAKMNQKDAEFFMTMINDVSQKAVDYLEQKVKPLLLKQGVSREEIQQVLRREAAIIVERNISAYGQKIISRYVGDFSDFVNMKVEQGVQVRKIEMGETNVNSQG
jgi:hypothetical protein